MPSSCLRAVLHALELPELAWVEALFEQGRSLFDEGQGLFVYAYRVGTKPALRLTALAGEHRPPASGERSSTGAASMRGCWRRPT